VRMLIVEEINGNKNDSIFNASDDYCGSKSMSNLAIVGQEDPEKIKISSGESLQVNDRSGFVCHKPDDLTLKDTSFADMHKRALFQTAMINIIPSVDQIWPAKQTLSEETDKSDKSGKLSEPGNQRSPRAKPRLSIILRSPSNIAAPTEDDLDLSNIVNRSNRSLKKALTGFIYPTGLSNRISGSWREKCSNFQGSSGSNNHHIDLTDKISTTMRMNEIAIAKIATNNLVPLRASKGWNSKSINTTPKQTPQSAGHFGSQHEATTWIDLDQVAQDTMSPHSYHPSSK
jgi:hypothetical protein